MTLEYRPAVYAPPANRAAGEAALWLTGLMMAVIIGAQAWWAYDAGAVPRLVESFVTFRALGTLVHLRAMTCWMDCEPAPLEGLFTVLSCAVLGAACAWYGLGGSTVAACYVTWTAAGVLSHLLHHVHRREP